MCDINYESFCTHFKKRWNRERVPQIALVRSVFTKSSINTLLPINIYQILPSQITNNVVKTIEENAQNPYIESIFLLSDDNSCFDPSILDKPALKIGDWKGITYSQVIKHFKPDTINILLYDLAVIDQHTIHNFKDIQTPTAYVLYPSQPDDNAIDTEGFVGIAFLGRPNIELNYYMNMSGSKEMVLKKIESSQYTSVNAIDIVQCSLYERNADYGTSGTYFDNYNFLFITLLPDSSTPSEIHIDQAHVFCVTDYDNIPLEPDIAGLDLIKIPEEIRLDIQTIKIQIAKRYEDLYRKIYIENLDNLEKRKADISSKIDKEINDARLEKSKLLFQIEDEYQRQKNKIQEKTTEEKNVMQKELEIYRDFIKDSMFKLQKQYEVDQKEYIDKLHEFKLQKTEEMNNELYLYKETESKKQLLLIEDENKKKIVDLEKQLEANKKHLDILIDGYRQEKYKELETFKNKRFNEIIKEIEDYKSRLICETDKALNEEHAIASRRIEKELNAKLTKKYNDEYIKITDELVKKTNKAYEERLKIVDNMIHMYKLSQLEQADSWIQTLKEKMLSDIKNMEEIKRKDIETQCKMLYDEKITMIGVECENLKNEKMKHALSEIKNEMQLYRLKQQENIMKEMNTIRTHKEKKLQVEIEVVKNENIENILKSSHILQEQLTQTYKNKLLEYEKDLETKKKTIDDKINEYEDMQRKEAGLRLQEAEEAERKFLLQQRDDVLNNEYNIKKNARENEIELYYNSRKKDIDVQVKLYHDNQLIEINEKLASQEKKMIEELNFNVSQQKKRKEESAQLEIKELKASLIKKAHEECEKIKEKQMQDILEETRKVYIDKQDILENELETTRKQGLQKIEKDLLDIYQTKLTDYSNKLKHDAIQMENSQYSQFKRNSLSLKAELRKELDEYRNEILQKIKEETDRIKEEYINEARDYASEIKIRKIQEIEKEVDAQRESIILKRVEQEENIILDIVLQKNKDEIDMLRKKMISMVEKDKEEYIIRQREKADIQIKEEVELFRQELLNVAKKEAEEYKRVLYNNYDQEIQNEKERRERKIMGIKEYLMGQ